MMQRADRTLVCTRQAVALSQFSYTGPFAYYTCLAYLVAQYTWTFTQSSTQEWSGKVVVIQYDVIVQIVCCFQTETVGAGDLP